MRCKNIATFTNMFASKKLSFKTDHSISENSSTLGTVHWMIYVPYIVYAIEIKGAL